MPDSPPTELISLSDDAWEEALKTVEADQGATWLESGRSPRVQVTPPAINESECVEVSVCDISASQVCVTVPVAAPDDWIERHRALLAAVRCRFPLV
ncbi:DUF5959 family protein [Streptomyces sp. NPDC057367]|uniref:DUF5959 family protein n=1 Tax=Streptomyces sp. NPDC057367 TaxID=3346108 RepID=UPI0036390E57